MMDRPETLSHWNSQYLITLRKEALREVGKRRGVYPRLVEQGKMREDVAAGQIRMMQDIATLIETVLQDRGVMNRKQEELFQ